MKKVLAMGILAVFMTLGLIQNAAAADATVAMDLNSAYVWRGITFNDGMVLQPSVDVSKGGFGFNVWGNMDLDDYDDMVDSGQFSEIDLTLSYSFDTDPVGVTIGYIEYLFPTTDAGGGLGTREIFVSLGMDLIEGLSAGLDMYYDFDEVEDYYLNLSLGYSVALSDVTSLDFGAAAGYAGDEYTADGDAGFYDYLLSVGISYAATENLSLSASINYTNSFDDDKLPDGAFAQDVNTFGGISIAYTF